MREIPSGRGIEVERTLEHSSSKDITQNLDSVAEKLPTPETLKTSQVSTPAQTTQQTEHDQAAKIQATREGIRQICQRQDDLQRIVQNERRNIDALSISTES